MNTPGSIKVGCFKDVAWIRVDGAANQYNSAELKAFAFRRIAAHQPDFVVDLENCTMMDSTFIGMLTAIVKEIRRVTGDERSHLEVLNANERNCLAMNKLGIGCVLAIDKEGSSWPEERKLVAENVTKPLPPVEQTKKEYAEMVLEAHQALVEANQENFTRFQDVIEYVKRDLESESSSG